MPQPDNLSLAAAARTLGYSTRHVRRLVDGGKLPATRQGALGGTRWRVPREAVARFQATRETGG